MSKNVASTATISAASAPEQLSLLTPVSVPLQFRLDERTRRTGLRHVAELRALLAAQAANRGGAQSMPRSSQIAA